VCKLFLFNSGTRALEKLNDFTGFFYDRKRGKRVRCVCVSKEEEGTRQKGAAAAATPSYRVVSD